MSRFLLALLLSLPAAAQADGPRIEVAFVLDATGSMGPWIREARSRIKAIAEDLATGDPKPEIRFALVRYRDKGDAFVTQTVALTQDIEVIKKALDDTEAAGGGDTPEAVLEALHVGIEELDWSSRGKVLKLLYLVGDARPNVHPDSPIPEELFERALERGIVIHSIACGRMGRVGQNFFERVARLSEGRPFRLADSGPNHKTSAAGAKGATSLAAAVSGSARAYSDSVGVDFTGTPIEVDALKVPAVAESGLLGAQLRHVRDTATWADLWAAHASLGATASVPKVDFSAHHILVVGGADAGLELDSLSVAGEVQVATVRAAPAGVHFIRVPASDAPIIARNLEKEGAL